MTGSSVLQVRLTGDPYIVHCVETALIVEALHASSKALEDIDERYSVRAAPLSSLMSKCCFLPLYPFGLGPFGVWHSHRGGSACILMHCGL